MIRKNKAVIFVFVCSLVLMTAHSSYGSTRRVNNKRVTVADVMCEYAIERYNRGNIAEAVHEFSRVLLVDPVNETAKEYLSKSGLPSGIYTKKRVKQARPSVYQEDDFFSKRIQELEKLSKQMARRNNGLMDVAQQLYGTIISKDNEIVALKQQFVQQKDMLISQSLTLEEKDKLLAIKDEMLASQESVSEGQAYSLNLDLELDLRDTIAFLERSLTQRDEAINELKGQLAQQKKQIIAQSLFLQENEKFRTMQQDLSQLLQNNN